MIPKKFKKLSADVKDAIAGQARYRAEQEFTVPELSQDPKWLKLSLAAYNAMFTPAERARMKKLPDGWLAKKRKFYIHVKSLRHGGHESAYLMFEEAVLVPVMFVDHYLVPVMFVDHYCDDAFTKSRTFDGPAFAALAEHIVQREENLERIRQSYGKVRDFLSRFSAGSTKAMIEAWPEVLQLMPQGFFDDDSIVPSKALVVQSDELNKLLGLK